MLEVVVFFDVTGGVIEFITFGVLRGDGRNLAVILTVAASTVSARSRQVLVAKMEAAQEVVQGG